MPGVEGAEREDHDERQTGVSGLGLSARGKLNRSSKSRFLTRAARAFGMTVMMGLPREIPPAEVRRVSG
jgi:hypothetical protein